MAVFVGCVGYCQINKGLAGYSAGYSRLLAAPVGYRHVRGPPIKNLDFWNQIVNPSRSKSIFDFRVNEMSGRLGRGRKEARPPTATGLTS